MPRIQTTVVGSYPVPDWLVALPSEQALADATRVVIGIQEQAGIDLSGSQPAKNGPCIAHGDAHADTRIAGGQGRYQRAREHLDRAGQQAERAFGEEQ
jgi:hypothetical protein